MLIELSLLIVLFTSSMNITKIAHGSMFLVILESAFTVSGGGRWGLSLGGWAFCAALGVSPSPARFATGQGE